MADTDVPTGLLPARPDGAHHELELRGLHKRFGDNEVLKGVDLDLALGEVVVVLGPSGSGKSTLLRCMNLLETPTAGTLRVRGEPVGRSARSLVELRREVGMVFQQFNLFPHLTVQQNVAAGPILVRGVPKQEAEQRARDLLARVGIVGKDHEKPSRLSGGQQQRVAIARALALEPRIVLFDEPTSALDPELRGEVLDTMRSLAASGTTMAVVTHEIAFARQVATRVVFIDQGVVVEAGPPDEVLDHPRSDRLRRFLGRLDWSG